MDRIGHETWRCLVFGPIATGWDSHSTLAQRVIKLAMNAMLQQLVWYPILWWRWQLRMLLQLSLEVIYFRSRSTETKLRWWFLFECVFRKSPFFLGFILTWANVVDLFYRWWVCDRIDVQFLHILTGHTKWEWLVSHGVLAAIWWLLGVTVGHWGWQSTLFTTWCIVIKPWWVTSKARDSWLGSFLSGIEICVELGFCVADLMMV